MSLVKLIWLNKMHWLKWVKSTKIGFLNGEKMGKTTFKWGKTTKIADSVVLLAGNEICFVRKGDGFYRKKIEKKRS